MPWQQVILDTTRDDAQRLSDGLEEAGAVSVSLESADSEPLFEIDRHDTTPVWTRTRVTALFAEDADIAAAMNMLAALLDLPAPPAYRTETVADQNWARAWMDRWQPLRFGMNLWVVPSWHTPPDPAAVNIILDPGMAFGTGTHATTAMCLEWLADHPPRGLEVIDYGCGSGILAIAALRLGARSALGTDTDPQALATAHENADRNAVGDRLTLVPPDAISADSRADVLLANILAGPLVALAPRLTALLRPGGTLILSGLLVTQVAEVQAAYAGHFDIECRQRDEWAMLVGRKRAVAGDT